MSGEYSCQNKRDNLLTEKSNISHTQPKSPLLEKLSKPITERQLSRGNLGRRQLSREQNEARC